MTAQPSTTTATVSAAPVIADAGARPHAVRNALVLLLPLLAILWVGRAVLGPFVVAAAVAYAFTPVVNAMARRSPLPRGVVVLVSFLVGVAALGVLVALVGGQLANEVSLLTASGPEALATQLRQLVGGDTLSIGTTQLSVTQLATQIQAAVKDFVAHPGEAVHVAAAVAETGLQVVLTLIITFYFILDGHRFRNFLIRFFVPQHREQVLEVVERIHEVLARWLRGQLLLVGLVALVTYVILGPILHVPYGLALAIMTGVLEVIPLIGPFIATGVAGVVAFSSGGVPLAATVVAIYFVIRQLEDQVVMPVVIGRAVHLHPVVTIFAVLVGLSVYGVLGGLLAVPVAAALNVILHEAQEALYPGESGVLSEGDPTVTETRPATAEPAS